MASERDISRREFLIFSGKGVVSGAVAHSLPEYVKPVEPEPDPSVVYRLEQGRLRVQNYFSSPDHEYEDILHTNFTNPDLPDPVNNIGWVTRHGDTAYSDIQVLTKAQTYLQSSDYSRLPRHLQNVVLVYDAMQSTSLPSDRHTPEYADAFREMLRQVDFGPEYGGIDIIGAAAIKATESSGYQVGRIYKCKAFNRLTGNWESHYTNNNGELREVGFIVLDTQGDSSWMNNQPKQIENFVHGADNQPSQIPWCAEISHDVFTAFGFEYSLRPEFVQIEEVVPILNIGSDVFMPEMHRPNIINPEYQQLASTISQLFSDTLYVQVVNEQINQMVTEQTTTSTSDFITHLISFLGNLPRFENDNLDNIEIAMTTSPEIGVGIPIGSGTQAKMFTMLADSEQIPYLPITRSSDIDLKHVNSGYFYSQTYGGEFQHKTHHVCGMFINTGNEQYFAYVGNDGLVIKASLDDMVRNHFINYQNGIEDPNKRLVIFG